MWNFFLFLASSQMMLILLSWEPCFENYCSMIPIKHCLASLEEPWMKSNPILLLQTERPKAYVGPIFFFFFFFFFCQSILEASLVFWMLFLFGLHPIAEDWFIKILYLPWSVLGNWYISVCIGKVADFIQTILFTDIYVTILVNMWPHRPRNQVLSQFAKL